MKTGHFNLPTTLSFGIGDRLERNCPLLHYFGASGEHYANAPVLGATLPVTRLTETYSRFCGVMLLAGCTAAHNETRIASAARLTPIRSGLSCWR